MLSGGTRSHKLTNMTKKYHHKISFKMSSSAFVFVAFLLSACGGKKLTPQKTQEMVIPVDLAKAFEVKEFAPNQGVPKLEEAKKITTQGVNKKKNQKKKKKKGIAPSIPKSLTKEKGVDQSQPVVKTSDFKIPNRRVSPDPVWVNEKVWMDVTWLNTKAGEFLLEVLPFKEINGRKVYHLKGSAKTTDLISMVYKAEDWIESFVDFEGWFPYKFTLHGDETKHIRNHLELFDHPAKKQYVHIQDYRIEKNETVEKKGFFDLSPLSQDALSALNYIRNFQLKEGEVYRFPMSTNGSQWETEIQVIAKEEVSTKMGYLKAFKTKVLTRFNGVLQQSGDTFIWFSEDYRHFPLRFEAKVKIGWVAGIAKKIESGIDPQTTQTSQN